MSRETLNWLNTNTLIGFTDKRGHAWHWRAQEQDGELIDGCGPLPEISLGEVAAHLSEQFGLGWVLDAFGNGTHPERMCHLDDPTDDGGVLVGGRYASDERTVDLEVVDR